MCVFFTFRLVETGVKVNHFHVRLSSRINVGCECSTWMCAFVLPGTCVCGKSGLFTFAFPAARTTGPQEPVREDVPGERESGGAVVGRTKTSGVANVVRSVKVTQLSSKYFKQVWSRMPVRMGTSHPKILSGAGPRAAFPPGRRTPAADAPRGSGAPACRRPRPSAAPASRLRIPPLFTFA